VSDETPYVYEPKGIHLLPEAERLELAVALIKRDPQERWQQGRLALQHRFPTAPETMINTAAFHLYEDTPQAVIDFVADAELALRDPDHEFDLGVSEHILSHVYNWLQFEPLLPTATEDMLELLKQIQECVADDDKEGLLQTVDEFREILEGFQSHPDFM